MSGVHLLGVGATSFSRRRGEARPLAREAIAAALADAGLTARAVDGIAIAAADAGFEAGCLEALGAPKRSFLCRCGLGANALHAAWKAISAGAADVVLCVGHDSVEGGEGGLSVESLAAAARLYMRRSGATEEDLALVAAKNRAHGAANPHALLRESVEAAEVLASELLAWPLRRLMLAPPVEGATAVVLGGREVGRRSGPRVPRLRASVLVDDASREGGAPASAARLGYFSAELGPEDVDVAEVEDPTPVEELAAYEALEFAPAGSGPELAQSGFTAVGGVLPVNPSGGSLAQGRVQGSGAIRQLIELSLQLRDRAGSRQVPGARVALGLGGGWTSCASVATVTILST
ncbi:MAG TPA: thiolase family protein [Solirubrobacterales bacterium]